MARTTKKEEETVQIKAEPVKTESVKTETKTEQAVHETVEEMERRIKLEKLLSERKQNEEALKNVKKIRLDVDTPYVNRPNINTNVSGILPKGKILGVLEDIDAGANGSFWKINDQCYINKKWNGAVEI